MAQPLGGAAAHQPAQFPAVVEAPHPEPGLRTGIIARINLRVPIALVPDSPASEREPDWSHPDAALHGSSFYDLPGWLMWLTGNIGIHHLHHLSSRIPYYRLPEALADYPELRGIGRLTLWKSLACVRLTLWDKAARRMVPFAALKLRAA